MISVNMFFFFWLDSRALSLDNPLVSLLFSALNRCYILVFDNIHGKGRCRARQAGVLFENFYQQLQRWRPVSADELLQEPVGVPSKQPRLLFSKKEGPDSALALIGQWSPRKILPVFFLKDISIGDKG